MKINANEKVLLMNKKIGTMGAEPAPVPTTVSNPTNSMKALETMGQQNVAFQGGITSVAEKGIQEIGKNGSQLIKKGADKVGKGAMLLATAMMLGAPVITSCEKVTAIDVDVNTEIDLSALVAALNATNEQLAALTVLVANMQAQQAVQTELLRQQLTKLDEQYQLLKKMYTEQLDQGKTQDGIKEDLEKFQKDAIEQMIKIAELLGTDSPIYQAIMQISAQFDAGKLSLEEAYEKMMEVLKNIDSNVEDIKEQVTELVNEFKGFRKDFNNATDKFAKLLQDIQNGVITSKDELVSEIKELREEVKESTDGQKEALDKLQAAVEAADENNIAGNKDIVAQLEALGISADMSKEEIIAAIKENTQEVKNNGANLNLILSNTNVLPDMLEQDIITNEEMEVLIDAVKNLKVTAELDPEVQNIIEKIADKMDEVIEAINTQGGNITNELKKMGVDVSKIGDNVEDMDEKMDLSITYYQSLDDNVKELLEQAKATGSTVVDINVIAKQIGQDVAWIKEHGGGSGSTVDLSKLEAGVAQIVAELQAQKAIMDLQYAIQCKDSEEIKNISDKLDDLNDTAKELLTNDDSLLKLLETEFAALNIKFDENNETLDEILDAIGEIKDRKQVLIIIINMGNDESIKKYEGDSSKLQAILDALLEEIENIVEEEETTKTFAYSIPAKKTFSVAQFYETAARMYAQTPKAQKEFKAFQRAADQKYSKTFNA